MQKKEFWFPAKTHGWGWGLPVKWQGWLVCGVAVVLLVAASFEFPPITNYVAFMASILGIVSLLMLVCWLKGEPPRWRRGQIDARKYQKTVR